MGRGALTFLLQVFLNLKVLCSSSILVLSTISTIVYCSLYREVSDDG